MLTESYGAQLTRSTADIQSISFVRHCKHVLKSCERIKNTNCRIADWKSRTVARYTNCGCSSVIFLHYTWQLRTVSGKALIPKRLHGLTTCTTDSSTAVTWCACFIPIRRAALTKEGDTVPANVISVFHPLPFSYFPNVLNAAVAMYETP